MVVSRSPNPPTITDFTIILESLEFDAYLELLRRGLGNLLASDDNTFSEFDAEISLSLTELGKYYIRVMAADSSHGNYTLSINDEAHSYGTDFLFYGALIDASAGDGAVFINKGSSNFYNEFFDNNYTGIEVKSNSAITAYNLSASDNGDTGAYLNNATGSGNITFEDAGKRRVQHIRQQQRDRHICRLARDHQHHQPERQLQRQRRRGAETTVSLQTISARAAAAFISAPRQLSTISTQIRLMAFTSPPADMFTCTI